jgi:hypothetical protein
MTDEQKRLHVARQMNKARCDHGISAFDKGALLPLASRDEILLTKVIREWEAKGLLEVDWDAFRKGEGLAVFMKDYIEAKLPWFGPPS